MYDRILAATRARFEVATTAWNDALTAHNQAVATTDAEQIAVTQAALDDAARLRDTLTARLADLDARKAALTATDTEQGLLTLTADRDLVDLLDLRERRGAERSRRRDQIAARAALLAPLDGLADELVALAEAVRTPQAAADLVPPAAADELDVLAAEALAARQQQPTQRIVSPAAERLTDLAAALQSAAVPLAAAPDRADALAELMSWAGRLTAVADVHHGVADALTGLDVELSQTEARISELGEAIDEHATARSTVTSRLLGEVPAPAPLLLAPVRLETRWSGSQLQIRIYPDEIGVDHHDPRLTEDEVEHGRQFWLSKDREAAWTALTARMSSPRAAWVARKTAPGAGTPTIRATPMPGPPAVRLLPRRFAAIAFAGGKPIALDADGRRTAWGHPVTVTDAAIERSWSIPENTPENEQVTGPSPWTVDFAAALDAGMALQLDVPADAPVIDLLVVLGITPGDPGLAALLEAHAFSAGCEILADATPTNNSAGLRSGMTRRRAEDDAADLVDPTVTRDVGPAGTALAQLLGLTSESLALLPGARMSRGDGLAAARHLIRAGARGRLRELLGPGADTTLAALDPSGPAPVLRVGRQPYGILPVTAPGRWVPAPGESGLAVDDLLPAWAARAGLFTEAAEPTMALPLSGTPRRVVPDDDGSWDAVLAESGWSLAWTDSTTGAALPAVPSDGADDAMSVRLAAAARAAVSDTDRAALEEAITEIEGLPDANRVLGGILDSVSHRVDPWITAVCTERLRMLRSEHPALAGYGAYGWTTDVAPRPGPRSHGRLLAPSLAQAATGAVLRSGFLTERRLAWTQRVADMGRRLDEANQSGDPAAVATAQQEYDVALAGRRTLTPLDPDTEAALPLAVDLSSRRVREALRVLAAVRAGQQLGAVLGHRFERDLADSGQQAHLAAFRAVSRLRTGTDLDRLIRERDDAQLIENETLLLFKAAEQRYQEAQNDLIPLELQLAAAESASAAAQAALDAHPPTPTGPVDEEPGVVAALAEYDRASETNPYPRPKPGRPGWDGPILIDPNEPVEPVDNEAIKAWLERMQIASEAVRRARETVVAYRRHLDQERQRLHGEAEHAKYWVAGVLQLRDEKRARVTEAEQALGEPKRNYDDAVQARLLATQAVAAELRRALAEAGTATTLGVMVDGLDLRKRYRIATAESPPRWTFDTIPFPANDTQSGQEWLGLPVVGTPAYAAVLGVLRRLDSVVDAMADLLVAESVHHLVAGNPERSGAVLEPTADGKTPDSDELEPTAGGEIPDTVEVVRTPRPGLDVTHRVLLAWNPELEPRWGAAVAGVDALLDPALAAWASWRIPDPAGIRVRMLGPGSVQAVEFNLGQLELDSLGWVRLAAEPGELDRRLAAFATARGLTGTLRVVEDNDPTRTTPADLVAVAGTLGRLLHGARALTPDDVAPPGGAPAVEPDKSLAGRVAAAEQAVNEVLRALDAIASGTSADPEEALLRASALGIAEAGPDHGTDVTDPINRAKAAATRLRARIGDTAFTADDSDPADTHRRARMRAEELCGRQLPLLGPVPVPAVLRVQSAPDDSARIWLDDRARVRPAIETLCALADLGEVLADVEPMDAIGLRLSTTDDVHPLDPPVTASLGLVVMGDAEPLPEQATGLTVDAWTETVPGSEYTAGLAFHHQTATPDAPQALLVAVPPDMSATTWDLDTLVEVLYSTIVLATERVVATDLLTDVAVTVEAPE